MKASWKKYSKSVPDGQVAEPVANQQPRIWRIRLATGLALLLAGVCSCAQNPNTPAGRAMRIRQLAHTLANAANPYQQRISADQQLGALAGTNSPIRQRLLIDIICGQADSPPIKVYALASLAHSAPDLTRHLLHRRIYKMEHWRVLTAACHWAVSLHDRGSLDALFRSLKRPARRFAIPRRPEAAAIRLLCHCTLRLALWRKLGQRRGIAARLAALEILYRMQGAAVVKAGILKLAPQDPLIASLSWYIRLFGYVPHRASEVTWIEQLNQRPSADIVRQAQQRIGSVSGRGKMRYGIPPRYLALLAQLATPADYPPAPELKSQVAKLLAEHRHIRRPVPYPGAPTDIKPTLAANADRLTYCDLLLAKTLLQALGRATFVRNVWRMGKVSRRDTSSEEGGLILADRARNASRGLRLHLRLFAPAMRLNNTIYVSSPQLLLATPRGLAEFIFHFQKRHNARYTGPAEGDLKYVRHKGCSVVIFTSTGRRKFDTVLDTPTGAVLDLGISAAQKSVAAVRRVMYPQPSPQALP